MASYREIVYLVLDEIKSLNGDSTITEEHVIFLANHYRLFLLDLKIQKQGIHSLSDENKQTLCLDLEQASAIDGLDFCNDRYLKSIQSIPNTINNSMITLYPEDLFETRITYVSKNRFKYVGYNKYMANIIYGTVGHNNHVYLKSNNPQYLYLKKLKATGIFEDCNKAAELLCSSNGSNCDVLDCNFPLEASLIPSMIELIVKELYGAQWRLADSYNNSNDDVANLVAYLLKNTKSSLAKQIAE